MIQQRMQRLRVALVSSGFAPDDAERMGMVYYSSVEAALQDSVGRLPASQRDRSVGVLTHGGVLLPMIGVN